MRSFSLFTYIFAFLMSIRKREKKIILYFGVSVSLRLAEWAAVVRRSLYSH